MVIDEKLLEEARRLSGARTKRDAVATAMREMLVRLRRREMVSHAGTVETCITQADLRAMRAEKRRLGQHSPMTMAFHNRTQQRSLPLTRT